MNAILKLLRLEFLPTFGDIGLLILRAAFGAQMLIAHGWPKLASFSEKAGSFPDPLGIGHTTSAVLAIIGEVLCSVLLCLGFLTRFAALGSATTMAVAFLFVHGGKLMGPNHGEMAFLYLVGFVVILLAGPGRYSLDGSFTPRL